MVQRMYGWMDGTMEGRMDGWMDGMDCGDSAVVCKHGWMKGWMDRWMKFACISVVFVDTMQSKKNIQKHLAHCRSVRTEAEASQIHEHINLREKGAIVTGKFSFWLQKNCGKFEYPKKNCQGQAYKSR